MKRQMLLPLLMLACSCVAVAQPSLRVMDSILFKTDSPSDAPLYRAFGFAKECTDGYDVDHEILVPAFPPFSFFVAFTPEDIVPKPYVDLMQSDCRGVPDSASSGVAKTFWIDYELRFEGGTGQHVSIVLPARLARGLDSVRIQDVEGFGNIFKYTYAGSEEATIYTIPNTEVRYVMLRAYYNVQTLAVPSARMIALLRDVHPTPNPVRSGGIVRLAGEIPSGTKAVVRDVLGRTVQTQEVISAATSLSLDMNAAPAGSYFLQLISNAGEIIYSDRLVVAP